MTTSQLSMELDIEELTLSQEGSRANRLASPENAKELVMHVIYGPKCLELFGRRNPLGFWEKTSQGCLALTEVECLETPSVDWPTWAIVSGGECYQLTPLELATTEDEFSSLPTPTASDRVNDVTATPSEKSLERLKKGEIARVRKTRAPTLSAAVLPTPNAFDAHGLLNRKEGTAHKLKGGCKYLAEVLATPQASDVAFRQSTANWEGNDLVSQTVGKSFQETGERGRLNPLFVERMMGFPQDWTRLESEHSETQ